MAEKRDEWLVTSQAMDQRVFETFLQKLRFRYVKPPERAISPRKGAHAPLRVTTAKRRVSSRMATTDRINQGLEIRRGKSLGLFTRSSLIGTLMRTGFFITVITILASAQTREQIAAAQAQIAAREAQKNADLAISQLDSLQAQLDAISQGDALQAQLEDVTLAANRRNSLQNQPKTGEAAASPAPSTARATQDLALPPAAPSPSPSPAETPIETTPGPERGDDATSRAAALPAPRSNQPQAPDDAAAHGHDGGAATPDKVPERGSERMQGTPGAVPAQEDESPAAFTSAALRSKARGRHGYRPQPQLTFWQRLFGRKETKEAKNARPGKPRQ